MDIDERIIEEMRSSAILYDLGQADYKNVRRKEQAWREVSAILKLSELECKKRWKGLRDFYKRCKRLQQIASGSGAASVRKKWRYFDMMSFLDDVTSSRRTIGNVYIEEDPVEEADLDTEVVLSPDSHKSSGLRQKKKDDSQKFEEFLNLAASSIADIGGLVEAKKQHVDSTAMHFANLAAKIKEAGIPPSIINKIETKVSNLVFNEIENFFKNSPSN